MWGWDRALVAGQGDTSCCHQPGCRHTAPSALVQTPGCHSLGCPCRGHRRGNPGHALELTRCLLAPHSPLWEQDKALPPCRAGTRSSRGHGDHGKATRSSQELWRSSGSRDLASTHSSFPHPGSDTQGPAALGQPKPRTRTQRGWGGTDGGEGRDRGQAGGDKGLLSHMSQQRGGGDGHMQIEPDPRPPPPGRSEPGADNAAPPAPAAPGARGGPARGHSWHRTPPQGTGWGRDPQTPPALSRARLTSHTGPAVPATLSTSIETGREGARASTGLGWHCREDGHTQGTTSFTSSQGSKATGRKRQGEGGRQGQLHRLCWRSGVCPHLSVLLVPQPPLTSTLQGKEVPQHLGTAATVASLPSQGMDGFGTALFLVGSHQG